jgi:hypothetical protein
MIGIMDSQCASGRLVQNVQIVGGHSHSGEWSKLCRFLMHHGRTFSWWKMVQDRHSPGAHMVEGYSMTHLVKARSG